jgi:primosomal protein N' (replication factor Y)
MTDLIEVAFNLPLDRVFTYRLPAGTETVPGCRVSAPFGRRKLTGYVIALGAAAPPGVLEIREIHRVVDSRPLFTPELLEQARWLAHMYMCSLGEALAAMLPGARREGEADAGAVETPLPETLALSEQQQAAVRRIVAADGGSFYLEGITGSGKTAVFLEAAREILQRGRGVIYLVPEISLTHQVVELFTSEFGEQVAVLHSGLTASQRLGTWFKILDGEARLVIGARSAVFAPVRDLGLLVLDEEHESSYKSSATPRYHARQVAAQRSRREGAVLVMGSATPSLEAVYRMQTGRLERLYLPERLSGGTLPEIHIQDMRGEPGPLSRRLIEEILQARREKRQTILFLNRRGFSHYFHCSSCGFEMTCRNCSVSLTYHKSRNKLVCHYCGFKTDPLTVCPDCGSMDVGYSGVGTERVEEELARLFPDLRVRRVDTDSVRKRAVLGGVLQEFRAGRIDILVGTQMVAKGLNFPGVKLVGIVSADTGLQLPDFRAAERTFGLIVQVSGRAGRFHPDGRVLIQTFRPDNPTIRLAASGQAGEFYARELAVRREMNFPPFSRLIRLVFRSRAAELAYRAAGLVKREVTAAASAEHRFDVLGPAECPLTVIAGNTRCHLIFRAERLAPLHSLVRAVLAGLAPQAGVYIEVDVDPTSLL